MCVCERNIFPLPLRYPIISKCTVTLSYYMVSEYAILILTMMSELLLCFNRTHFLARALRISNFSPSPVRSECNRNAIPIAILLDLSVALSALCWCAAKAPYSISNYKHRYHVIAVVLFHKHILLCSLRIASLNSFYLAWCGCLCACQPLCLPYLRCVYIFRFHFTFDFGCKTLYISVGFYEFGPPECTKESNNNGISYASWY